MIKAIIFDLNGVFIQSPKLTERFLSDFNVSVEESLPALKEVMAQVRMPNAKKVFELWKPYFQKWGIDFDEQKFLDYWFGAEKENEKLTNFARELKQKGFKLFILSNNFSERANYYAEHFSFLSELFEKIYYSWQSGYVKPDVQAFELIISENNLDPSECLYFDDSDENILAAKSLGITAASYINDEQLMNDIKYFLVS